MEENRLRITKLSDSPYKMEGTAEQDNALYSDFKLYR